MSQAEEISGSIDKTKSFWATLPGIFTGLATLITALGGFITIFYQLRSNPAPSATSVLTKEQGKRALSSRHHQLDTPFEPNSRNVPEIERTNTNNRVPRIPMIAGAWTDPIHGNRVLVRQDKNQVVTETISLATGQKLATGVGVISGLHIKGSYQWMDGSRYTAMLTMSENEREINGTVQNIYTGQTGALHLVR